MATIVNIGLKSTNNKVLNHRIWIATQGFDPQKHRIILCVNNAFIDDLKEYFTKDIYLPEPKPQPVFGGNALVYNPFQKQIPDPGRSVSIYALLYDYQRDIVIDCKRQEYEYKDMFKTFFAELEIINVLKEKFNRYFHKTRTVASVEGPFKEAECKTLETEVKIGTKYYFRAIPKQFVSATEMLLIKWQYRYDDDDPKSFNFSYEKGIFFSNVMSCTFDKNPSTIKVYAFFRKLNEKVSLVLDVFGASNVEVVADDNEKDVEKKCKCNDYELVWGSKVDCEFRKKVSEIAKRQQFDPNHLMAVMYVETSHTFSTSLVKLLPTGEKRPNRASKYAYRGLTKDELEKYSDNFKGAVGLIQFTENPIKDLNKVYKLSLTKKSLALMSQLEQLDYVEKYIALWKKTNKIKSKLTLSDLYVLVFAPSKMGSSDDTVLYKEGSNAYTENKSLDEENNNDGKITKKELAKRAENAFDEGSKPENKKGKCDESQKIQINSKIVFFETGLSYDRKLVVKNKSISLLEEVAKKTNNPKIIITSTIRTPRKQAEAMYVNEEKGKHLIYKKPGKEVQKIYSDGKKIGETKNKIIDDMTAKIVNLFKEGLRVSLHCVPEEEYEKLNVLDVSVTLANPIDFITELNNQKDITRVIHPIPKALNQGKISYDTKEQAIHIEIKQ